jgi:glycosyltransferase involved in cell wall biosynthesis
MSNPLVSVVMVTCNVERFLAQSIDSILHQTFSDFEFIIVDYGSTDSSKRIIAHYVEQDPRVHLHEIPRYGLGESRNAACSLARGKYIAIMDADDVALPARLQLEVDFMERHPRVGLLGGAVQWISATGKALYVACVPTDDRQLRKTMAVHCPFWQPTVLLRTEAFVRAGGYRRAFASAEDYDLWLRVAEHFECANLKDVVLKYRIHPQQVSMQKQGQQTLGILAAQRSAALRREGQRDVFESVDAITPEVLTGLGVDEATQEKTFVSESRLWIRNMSLAGENSAALDAAVRLLHADWTHVEKWQIADLHLTVAGLRWKRGEFSQSIRSAMRAIRLRPTVLGRPLRPWLERIRLIHAEYFFSAH